MTTLIAVRTDHQPDKARRTMAFRAQEKSVGSLHPTSSPDEAARGEWEQNRLDDYRRRGTAFAPVPRREEFVDAVLAESFPASDPPPWTLGVSSEARTSPSRDGIIEVSTDRAGSPTWWQGVISLFGAGIVALLFAIGILVVGSVVALAVRLLVEALAGTSRVLLSIAG